MPSYAHAPQVRTLQIVFGQSSEVMSEAVSFHGGQEDTILVVVKANTVIGLLQQNTVWKCVKWWSYSGTEHYCEVAQAITGVFFHLWRLVKAF